MSIRLRTINGIRVALCAAKTKAQLRDTYLDDGDHYALARKFSVDYEIERGKDTREGRLMISEEDEHE